MEEQSRNMDQEANTPHYDLSEESSKRSEGEGATQVSRQIESDDLNEETAGGQVDRPHESGLFGSNKLPTSLGDE
jgi:hypothetical protein